MAAAVDGARRPPLPTTTPASVTDELSAAIGEARRDGDLDGSPAAAAAAAAAADQFPLSPRRPSPTDIFGYDAPLATPVAMATVREWLEKEDHADRIDAVVFCVFSDDDLELYSAYLHIIFLN